LQFEICHLKIYIIIPVKPFAQAKTRLAPVLRKPLRATLARALLTRTLDIANAKLETWNLKPLVISRDLMALDIARSKGAAAMLENGHDLNSALNEARQWAMQNGAGAILVLPADLPMLTTHDVEAMIELACEPACVVIAPDRHERGTNALLLHPPDALHFAFGPRSFDEHRALAKASTLKLHVYRSPTIAFDLDTPDDLKALRNACPTLDDRHLRKTGF